MKLKQKALFQSKLFGLLGGTIQEINTINEMKKILYLAITLICMTSCYLPRILYSTESVMPSAECDSIEVTLLRGDIISSGGSDPAMAARLDIVNRKTTSVSLLDSPVLELFTDNHILLFEEFERKDTLASNSTIPSHERKEVTLYFKSQDDNYVTYQSLKKEGKKLSGHKLCLTLHLKDCNGINIEKKIVLIPTKTKRM